MSKMNKAQSKKLIIEEMANSVKRDAILQKDLQLLYMFAIDNIEKEIQAFAKRYEEKGINVSELKRRATKEEIEALNRRVEQYVKQKELTTGEHLQVDELNALSNLTRLELLQYHIDVAMLELTDSEKTLSEKFLNQEYLKGLEISARTLGVDALTVSQMATSMNTIIQENFKGQKWSETLWKNQEALRSMVSVTIADSLLRGKNPQSAVGKIRKEFNVSRNVARRLLITEGTRVNATAQVEMLKANDYEYFEIVPESSACDYCKPLANKLIRTDEALSGETIPPFHPYCKCGLVASVRNIKTGTYEDFRQDIYDVFDFVKEKENFSRSEIETLLKNDYELGKLKYNKIMGNLSNISVHIANHTISYNFKKHNNQFDINNILNLKKVIEDYGFISEDRDGKEKSFNLMRYDKDKVIDVVIQQKDKQFVIHFNVISPKKSYKKIDKIVNKYKRKFDLLDKKLYYNYKE